MGLSIKNSLPQFVDALSRGQKVCCDPNNGCWKIETEKYTPVARTKISSFCCSTHKTRALQKQKIKEEKKQDRMNHEHQRLVDIGAAFNRALGDLESIPVQFGEGSHNNDIHDKYAAFQKAAVVVTKYLNDRTKSTSLREHIDGFALRLIGTQYRLESANRGLSPLNQADPVLFNQIKDLATTWKANQALIPDADKPLATHELRKIEEACRYPKFAELLVKSSFLKATFFKWIIQDANNVQQFIEFPDTCIYLKKIYLASRIGRLGPSMLAIKKQLLETEKPHRIEKVLCLPFFDGKEVKQINILDQERQVTLNGNRHIKIKEIFNIFSKKKELDGDVEMFGTNGIMNWDLKRATYWDFALQKYNNEMLKGPQWWENLPIFDLVSKTEVERRYQVKLKSDEWVRATRASRTTRQMAFEGAHGFIEVAIPLKNGKYGIYSFAKFPIQYPQGREAESIFVLLSRTIPGAIAYPDPNVFYSHRQQAFHAKVIGKTQGKDLMKIIRRDMLKTADESLPFNLGGANCSEWTQTTIAKNNKKEPTPNYFRLPILEGLPKMIKGAPDTRKYKAYKDFAAAHYTCLWRAYRVLLPIFRTFQRVSHTLFNYPDSKSIWLAGMYIKKDSGTSFVSIADNEAYQKEEGYEASMMLERIEKGELTGCRLFHGHGFYVSEPSYNAQ